MVRLKVPSKAVAVSHYHQRRGVQPTPRQIKRGDELVEVVTGGRGWVETEGSWREVGKGDLLWHIGGDLTIGRSDPEDPYRCLAVRFQDGIRSGRRTERFSRWWSLETLESFTKEAVGLFVDERMPRDGLTAYLFGRLLMEASRPPINQTLGSLHPAIAPALKLIDACYREPLKVEQVAEAAGCTPAHLNHLFRRHLGQAPHRVLIERRVRAARERLAAGNEPVKSIALECGFTHAAAFCHTFGKLTGESPSQFRARQRLSLLGD